MLEKLFETNTLVFRHAYREGKLEEARIQALQDVKKVRFGDIEKWKKKYDEHIELFKACLIGTLFTIFQWAMFFLIRETFHCSMNWTFYVVGAEILIFVLGTFIYSDSNIENKTIDAFLNSMGGLSGAVILIGIGALYTALFVDLEKIRELKKNYEKGPFAYCMMIYPDANVQQRWFFKECKAKVLEVNAKKEYSAHLAIGKEINEWEKARQKKLAKYKELRDFFMWSKIAVILMMAFIYFLGYKGIIYMDRTPNFTSKVIIFLIVYFIIMSIFQNHFAKKYNKLLNKEIYIPEIYKVYFYEE